MRCFVAVDLADDVLAAVLRVQARLRKGARAADVRWTDRAQLHVTLKFLGAVPDDRVPAVSEALDAAGADVSPIALEAAGVGAFPSLGRPRVLWVGIGTGAAGLARAAAAVDRALAPLGHPPEARPFSAHVTIGRVRSPRDARTLATAVAAADAAALGTWTASEVVLYESRLRPAGALYVPVSRHALRGARP